MSATNFIQYLKTLKPEDWQKKVNEKWTVKDLVSHMVGWEKEDVAVLRVTWKNKKQPWFYDTDNFEDFNRKSVEYYKNYTPQQLILEWEYWQHEIKMAMIEIGEDNLMYRYDLFSWLFREDEDGHYVHHLKQIKAVVEKVKI